MTIMLYKMLYKVLCYKCSKIKPLEIVQCFLFAQLFGLLNSLCLIFALIGNKLSYIYNSSDIEDPIDKISHAADSMSKIFDFPLVSLDGKDMIFGILVAVVIRLLLYVKMQDQKNYRKGEEYGSASFGTAKDIEPFIDWENFYNNILLSATERLSMNHRMKDPTANRNKNILLVGGSGSGKTRGHVKPNLMQTFGSYIVTDSKGSVIYEVGTLLMKAGYEIMVLNTINFKRSMHYNPFAYIRNETDIMKVVDAFVSGTTTVKQQGEQFWVDAEKLLYNALIGYIMKVGLLTILSYLILSYLILSYPILSFPFCSVRC